MRMHWLRAHPYIAALIAAGILILLGTFIVKEKTAVQSQGSDIRVWSGGGHLLNPTVITPNYTNSTQENIYSEVQSGPPFYYNPISVSIPSANGDTDDEFDFDAFLAMLSQPAGASTGGNVTSDTSLNAYSFIPGGLISTSTSQKTRTPREQALYNYGNEVGSTIQSFESSFRNAPQTLKNQFEDREDPTKNQALNALAEGLARVGRTLEKMETVPPEIATAHAKVAASYQEMGEKLARISGARGDEEFLELALAYNATVETYTQNYIALATLISAYSITFTPNDPGSVFTFTNVSL